MSQSKDKAVPQSPQATRTSEPKQSGRVAFDPRGNPIWEWQTSTGVFGRDVSTQRLKTLEAKELSLVDTQPVERPKKLELEDAAAPGGGMNPYNSSGTPAAKPKSQTAKPVADPKAAWWTKKKSKRV